jgi:hypothetical protein
MCADLPAHLPTHLQYYDIILGAGAEAKEGQRVAVHYDVKFRNVSGCACTQDRSTSVVYSSTM